jgi:hypothetical protein
MHYAFLRAASSIIYFFYGVKNWLKKSKKVVIMQRIGDLIHFHQTLHK